MTLHRPLTIPTTNGRLLGARLYEPAVPILGQVVIHGATATPQRYYGSFARHLAWRGLRVLTYDYRGVGDSALRSMADDPVTLGGWIEDAHAAQGWLVDRAPSLPLTSIGHSFGGQIAAGIDAGRRPSALLLVGTGSGWWRGYPPARRSGLWLAWSVGIPVLSRSFGYLPGWAGLREDLPRGVAQQWARWCMTPGYFSSEFPQLRRRLADYEGNVLALSFTDDDYAPSPNVRWLLDRLRRAQVTHRHLAPAEVGLDQIGHFGAFRPRAAEQLWPMASRFLVDATTKTGEGVQWRPSPALMEVMDDLQYGRR